jgi:hypothetical protein
MSEHERETDFVVRIIAYDDTAERETLQARMYEMGKNERCVRRAAGLMLLSTALAVAGLVYLIIFAADFPLDVAQLLTRLSAKALGVVALGSLICAVTFVALGLLYRREFNRHREECRRLGVKILEARLGEPQRPVNNGHPQHQPTVIEIKGNGEGKKAQSA